MKNRQSFLGRGVPAALAGILYLAFAAQLDWAEVAMAAVAGMLALTALHSIRRHQRQRAEFMAPPLGWLARIVGKLASDSWRVLAALVVSLFAPARDGALRVIPFAPGGDSPRDVARRTWVTLGKSLTPNGIVIFVDRPNQRLLMHKLVASGESDHMNKEWPA
ncbi:MAG TPA: hypothetical protein VFI31_02635 [Pirellulales bacterium]|nr:hypothetical protein [Pirellulales bacterium]